MFPNFPQNIFKKSLLIIIIINSHFLIYFLESKIFDVFNIKKYVNTYL